MNEILFYIVILLANIIQGITGFAGTILAMPFSLILVGYDVAKPVLNVLGLLSGIYVFLGKRKYVDWKELRKIVLMMTVGIFLGMGMRYLLHGQEKPLYLILGVFVIVLAVQGFYGQIRQQVHPGKKTAVQNTALLVGAGMAHGIFVSGGPLLIGYLTRRLTDKETFRATISTVWIVLNTIILVGDIQGGLWNFTLVKTQVITIPFLLVGMFAGSRLYLIMSQRFFMLLTYGLLFISGITLLVK